MANKIIIVIRESSLGNSSSVIGWAENEEEAQEIIPDKPNSQYVENYRTKTIPHISQEFE